MTARSAETVAERIVRAREAAGFSTAQLARRLGVRTRTLSAWEDGRAEPRANRLAMLAGVLNVSPTWLLVGQGSAPSSTDSELTLMRGELVQLRAMHDKCAQIIDQLDAHISRLESRSEAAEYAGARRAQSSNGKPV